MNDLDPASSPARPAPAPPFAKRTTRLRSSAIRDLLKLTASSDILSLAGGLPAPDSFPVAELRREADRLLGEFGARSVQYSTTDGVVELRSWIADHAAAATGRSIDAAQVLVTHGSQQGLDLIAKVMLDPGDVVVVEAPSYLGAIQALELFEPTFVSITGDRHGLDTRELADRLAGGLRPKLVYVVANFHNPTGATLADERRRELAELADRYGFLVVEDDPYGAIRFAGSPIPPVLAHSERVVHLSTFSKIVAPGFRVGWAIGPPEVMAMLARAKQAADLHTSTFAQLLLANVVDRPGWLEEQQRRIVPIYRDRCVALCDAIDAVLGEQVAYHRPDGGMFVWLAFAGGALGEGGAPALLSAALEHGMAFVPGTAFEAGDTVGRFHHHARLSYATCTPAQLVDAVDRLAAALAEIG